jgi:HD-like signal output (HDOD) protein
VVGGLLATNWGLPEHIRTAILLHHDITVFDQKNLSNGVVTLIALGHVAEHVETALSKQMNDCECENFGKLALAHLMVESDEVRDFIDMAKDLYGIH